MGQNPKNQHRKVQLQLHKPLIFSFLTTTKGSFYHLELINWLICKFLQYISQLQKSMVYYRAVIVTFLSTAQKHNRQIFEHNRLGPSCEAIAITHYAQNYAHYHCNYATVHIHFNDYQHNQAPACCVLHHAMLQQCSYILRIMLNIMLMRKLALHFVPSWHDYYISQLKIVIQLKSDDQNVYKSIDNDF